MPRGHKGLSRPKKREKALKGKGIPRPKKSIEEILEKIDEPFVEEILEKIDEPFVEEILEKIDEPFGVGFEAEFNSIRLCSTSDYTKSPAWLVLNYENFKNGGAIYTLKDLTLTTEKSKKENCFDIEAQIGVFKNLSLPGFNESCQYLKTLLDSITPITGKDSNAVCKAQMTLSFHISKYPSIFSFYHIDPYYKGLYDGLKEKTKDLGDTVFGFILYTSYYFVILQRFRTPSLIVKQMRSLQKQLENINKEIDMLVEKQKVSWTSEMQQNISLLGLKRTTLTKHIKNLKESIGDDSNLDVLPVISQSIFKASFPLKPRTNIYELFLELSKGEQYKIMTFDFDILTGFDKSIIWDMTPMQLFTSLSKTPANKIGGIEELPLNEIFDFCKRKKKQALWDQLEEKGGKPYYSTNFVNVGPKGFIAIEFRDFKTVAKLAGYTGDFKDGLTIDEFQDRVGAIVDNFLIPFFRAQKSAFKYRKSLKKIPMKSKSKKSKTKERNKTCNRGSKSGQKTKR